VKKTLLVCVALAVIFLAIKSTPTSVKTDNIFQKALRSVPGEITAAEKDAFTEISDVVKQGETFFDIFKRNSLDVSELYHIGKASSDIYDLKNITSGQKYAIRLDEENRVLCLTYCIDDDYILNVTRTDEGFSAKKVPVEYEKKIKHMGGVVEGNLVSSMDDLLLSLKLSDIFAWDIDFATDLREGDTYKVVVEELWLDGEFKKYGEILSAEITNNGQTYDAYRFQYDGEADYYDSEGNSLRRAFLKAPLSYRRISSGFTHRRFHPILRIYRPHLGVDYAAPTGTPVSAVGDGTVVQSGYKGQNGRQVVIRHPNGYVTYYGHLSRIKKGVSRGAKVKQGQVIGYVGSTGLATGPHLDYRIKLNGRFIDPTKLKMPRGGSVPESLMAEFEALKARMDTRLTSISVVARSEDAGEKG
jgi:murein DD-endopeptidase MepM/ murein hydrolase activator NlpD